MLEYDDPSHMIRLLILLVLNYTMKSCEQCFSAELVLKGGSFSVTLTVFWDSLWFSVKSLETKVWILFYFKEVVFILQDSTIGVRRIHTYAYFYWHTHDFGHVYVDTYAHFSPMIFQNFQNLVCSFDFILFTNLML